MTQDQSGREVRVLTAPLFDPGVGRVYLEFPQGLTIGEIIDLAIPDLPHDERSRLRVTLTSERGVAAVGIENWARVRPRAGVGVVIRLIPGKTVLRAALTILVTVAAIALGQAWAGSFALATGLSKAVAGALLTGGLSRCGCLQVDSLR